ncbi:MAG: TldD/PmbA family protein [Candidatus Obscuribacterales bacterium]|nr:TldD/PmbA family protein [Candidatus Obscuribacterales bacterium]
MNKELALYALDVARSLGASYADARLIKTVTETVETRDLFVVYAADNESIGLGIRVLVRGGWGFATARHLTKKGVVFAVTKAVEAAKASSRLLNGRVKLAKEAAHQAVWQSPFSIDPFKISTDEKVSLLLECEKLMRKTRGVKQTSGLLTFTREKKLFVSTEGSEILQTFLTSGCGIDAQAGVDEHFVRSWPNSFGGQYESAGWEMVQRWDLLGNAQRVAEESVAVSKARQCPEMVTDVILGASQLALQIHESTGHPTELDRVFGEEENYAGASFLTPDNLGKLKYGSKIVNLTANATVPNALGTFAYDDDGVPGQRVELVKNGLFVGYLTSRETAHELGLDRSGGMMRATGPGFTPLVRMTNVSLEPGDAGSLQDLIADTKKGILLDTNYSWSIDDRRHNFQFGTEIGWLIKNGKIVEPVRNPSYWGITTNFWNSCDAICGPSEHVYWGIPTCAKGQPCQAIGTGHGAAPARFKNTKVGVAKPAEDKPKGGAHSKPHSGHHHAKVARHHRHCAGGSK